MREVLPLVLLLLFFSCKEIEKEAAENSNTDLVQEDEQSLSYFTNPLLDNGADLMSVKELLGHEDLSSTQVYIHVSVEKMKKIYKLSHPHGK